jgi:hypothetical protein
MRVYGLTVFVGAFLLFAVQPLIGKRILPWFGGGPAVWTTCLLFFQVLLLGGYAYAHLLSRRLRPRAQALTHLALLAAALASLPWLTPSESWKPADNADPTLRILALLAASLGLPFFVLSSTSPLLQAWFSLAQPGRSPYRLYALSNAGALLALLSYPFLIEPHLTRQSQAELWAGGLVFFVLCCAACALALRPLAAQSSKLEIPSSASGVQSPESGKQSLASGLEPGSEIEKQKSKIPNPSPLDRLLWVLLPACASVLLLATTNKLCQDVAVVPFLWVLPLALYLSSFILCFDSPRWYRRVPFTLAFLAAQAGVCWALFQGTELSVARQVAAYGGALFVCCMVCHGELYRLRPDPRHLTAFYLLVAAGGALGGFFVAMVAPLVLKDYLELHWGLWLCALLLVLAWLREPRQAGAAAHWPGCLLTALGLGGIAWFLALFGSEAGAPATGWLTGGRLGAVVFLAALACAWAFRKQLRGFQQWRRVTHGWLVIGLAALGLALWMHGEHSGGGVVCMSRNFYGVLTVFDREAETPQTTHGLQFLDPGRARWATGYYGEESGAGRAWRSLPAGARRIGLVGLGVGTLTAYAQPGDYLRVYEINPEVLRLACSQFSYLARCPGRVDLVPGDARLSLEREPPQHFDLLALDAFNSDAVPLHLLTREAFAHYARHLNPNGVIAAHVSNQHVDLLPVLLDAARALDCRLALIADTPPAEKPWLYSSTWVLLTRNDELLRAPLIRDATYPLPAYPRPVSPWTDDFASLFPILK